MEKPMKTIGLIGGMSWESTAEYYRIVNEAVKARLGGFHSARCILFSIDFADLECFQQDADGSAKVAIIGIERSTTAWATLLCRFPDHEDIIFAFGTLRRLLRQVEAAFPRARAFLRPGFDTTN